MISRRLFQTVINYSLECLRHLSLFRKRSAHWYTSRILHNFNYRSWSPQGIEIRQRLRIFSNKVGRIALLSVVISLGGCAHVWVDAAGNRHALGLMHVTLPSVQAAFAAETLRVQTLGLTWTHADAGSAFVLGYGDTTLGFIRNDSCVVLNRAKMEVMW